MRTRPFIIVVGLLCLFVFASCSDDDPYIPKPPKQQIWPALDQKDDIFAYLEKVYEDKNADRLDLLLDDNFTFIFSLADYNEGITPEQWKKNEELGSARNMFNNFAHPKFGSITSIVLEIIPEGLWTEVQITEPPYTGETWYQKVVEYNLIVETTSDFRLESRKRYASFTVRQSEVEGKNIYRIILWRDDIILTTL